MKNKEGDNKQLGSLLIKTIVGEGLNIKIKVGKEFNWEVEVKI